MVRSQVIPLLCLSLGLVACAGHKAPDLSTQEAAASARIEAIPAADPAKFHVARGKSWRNPYLIVKPDGVALLDVDNNLEHIIKPDELTEKLAALPSSAWPYGRVVAVTESAAAKSDHDKAEMRKNKAIVAGTLEGMHVMINWIPSA